MANMCTMLVQLKYDIKTQSTNPNCTKQDICDMVDNRISEIAKQLISTPYCHNFSFNIDVPPESDMFDRKALYDMELCDAADRAR
jgi:hypothetical protein